ncbi:9382_t:CDS:1, partial [Dentiscutata heterogama]
SSIDNADSNNLAKDTNSTWAKILFTYCNIVEDSKSISDAEGSHSIVSSNITGNTQCGSFVADKDFSSKHVKIEKSDEIFDNVDSHYFHSDEIFDSENVRSGETEDMSKKSYLTT